MKKILFFAVMAIALVGCSSDDEKEGVVDAPVSYRVVIVNNIDKNEISASKSDGNLYDVYLMSVDDKELNFYSVGDVLNKESVKYDLPSSFNDAGKIICFLKYGRDKQSAMKSNYHTPEQSYGKMVRLTVKDKLPALLTITENTTYSSYDFSDIGEFKDYLITFRKDMFY